MIMAVALKLQVKYNVTETWLMGTLMASDRPTTRTLAVAMTVFFVMMFGMNFLAGLVDGLGGPDIDKDEPPHAVAGK